MTESLPNTHPGTLARDNYVPLAQQESEQSKKGEFAWSLIKALLVTKLSAAAGYLGVKYLAKGNLKIGKFNIDPATGAAFTGIGGALYEAYEHWHKAKGQQVGVKHLSADLNEALDPAALEKETKKEREIVQGIEELLKANAAPRTQDVLDRREAATIRER